MLYGCAAGNSRRNAPREDSIAMSDPEKHGWFAEFRRRRVLRTLAAYLVGAWLLLQIANVTFPPLGLPDWLQRVLIITLAVGIVPVAILAWLFDITPQGIVRTAPRAGAEPRAEADTGGGPAVPTTAGSPRRDLAEAILAAPAGDARQLAADVADTVSVAILPFADMSAAHDQDWFCDGLAEEIIDALCCVRGLRVASRTASFRFRDGSVDPREIGRQLRVGAVLEGSVRKAGERLRITVQLIDTGTGYHLWSETYDRQLEDVFAIQSEIARKVSAALRVSLTGEEAARSERYAPRNLQAHEFYLRGRQLIGTISVADWSRAPAMFRRAIELDPDYAQAYAGLADSLTQLILWRFSDATDILPEAKRAAHRALELAPDLAEAHVALGHARSLTGDVDGATRSFERALELNPELHEAYYYFARHAQAHGDQARAAEMYLAAFRRRPDEYTVLALAIAPLDAIGDHARAEAAAREARAGLQHQLELDPEDVRAHYLLACVYARLGDRAAGLPHVEAAERLRPDDYATLYNAACYYSLAGQSGRALDLLERAFKLGGGSRDWIQNDHDLLPLHGNPRFEALLDRLDSGPPKAVAPSPPAAATGSAAAEAAAPGAAEGGHDSLG